MEIEIVNRIKKLALIALASDDELIESIVLKGGNAIDLVFKETIKVSRSSLDLDFSVLDSFDEDEQTLSERIKKTLIQTYAENDLILIDYNFSVRPENIAEDLKDFWGGYYVEFKVVPRELFEKHKTDSTRLRNSAIGMKGPGTSNRFQIDFSKFEYVGKKQEVKIDGFHILIYSPEMIVFEKVRAICQQIPEYKTIVPSHNPRPRARDFYDIHLIMDLIKIQPSQPENIEMIFNVFQAKRVPLGYIKKIREHKSIHANDWPNVKATLSATAQESLNDFDYYFDFVLNAFEDLTFP